MALIKEFKINNETNSIFLNDKFIENSWKQRSIMWGDPLHKTCAYNAMFPIRVADFFIKKYTNKKDIVLDPFSGRGTTLLQARILNRISYASDLNPLSYVLSKSKEKNLDLEKIINRVNELKKNIT
ncbi:DNA methyltransferase [Metamycoplasma alkalescens]|uniref:DNA methyltransferase n=1 Tax=Metamycoplasma alkalescens TaxID=45363 RepID=UPI0003A380E5|nr:DNA methyltransferase [Metamycoplasma alkalescens]